MARRSREAIQKRLRERKRAEKAEVKRQKRLERKRGLEPGEGELEAGGIVTAGQTEGDAENGAVDGTGDEAVAVGGIEPTEADDQPQPEQEARELHPTID